MNFGEDDTTVQGNATQAAYLARAMHRFLA